MVPPTDKRTPNPGYISYPSGAERASEQSCRCTAPGSGVLTHCPKGQGWAATPGVQAGGGLTLVCGHEVPHPHPWVWQGAGASGLQPALGSPCTSSRVSGRDFPLLGRLRGQGLQEHTGQGPVPLESSPWSLTAPHPPLLSLTSALSHNICQISPIQEKKSSSEGVKCKGTLLGETQGWLTST